MLRAIFLNLPIAFLSGVFCAAQFLSVIFTVLYVAHSFELLGALRRIFIATEKDENNPFVLNEGHSQRAFEQPPSDTLESMNWINGLMEWFIFNFEDSKIAKLVQQRLIKKLETKLEGSSARRIVVY